jgi:hypothetical protein
VAFEPSPFQSQQRLIVTYLLLSLAVREITCYSHDLFHIDLMAAYLSIVLATHSFQLCSLHCRAVIADGKVWFSGVRSSLNSLRFSFSELSRYREFRNDQLGFKFQFLLRVVEIVIQLLYRTVSVLFRMTDICFALLLRFYQVPTRQTFLYRLVIGSRINTSCPLCWIRLQIITRIICFLIPRSVYLC